MTDDPRASGADPDVTELHTGCVIAGGGPAGMMLGLLLARQGIAVTVLEKHADFLRDFRGDTIHPSTLAVIDELGLLDAFLARPHQKVDRLAAFFGEEEVPIADFRRLRTRCRFIALMPQWDFLDFLAGAAKAYPNFRLLMRTAAEEAVEERGRVVGLRARGEDGRPVFIRADLAVAADGRRSTLRAASGLRPTGLGAPIDVLWLRLPRRADDPDATFGRLSPGRMLVMINRRDYWQCAFLIPKGGFDAVKAAGIDAFRSGIAAAAPFLAGRTGAIGSWDDVSLLSVAVDRLERWHRPGLLFIGDAAHAMSPVGGVGINLAIQDAVAAARLLAPALRDGFVGNAALARVEARRRFPTRVTQRLQVIAQNALFRRVFEAPPGSFSVPAPLRLLQRVPMLQWLPARLVGIGVRPEHVGSSLPAVSPVAATR